MRITIEIDTENGAFCWRCPGTIDMIEFENVVKTAFYSISENSRRHAREFESVLFDSNGNRCGFVRGEYDDMG